MRLLFVCTGNICRSAAADRLATSWSRRRGGFIDVRSAGTRARPGRPMHPYTEAALQGLGVDAGEFASTPLDAGHVEWADLILTMTAEHREEVLAVSPRGMRKVFTLGEAAELSAGLPASVAADELAALLGRARSNRRGRETFDVTDPIDGPGSLHEAVVDEIAAHLATLLEAIEARRPSTGETMLIRRLPPVPPASRR